MDINELIGHINKSPQHNYVYHFTDESNFAKIVEKGLLSKTNMRSQGWWPKNTGGNSLSHELDDHRGISDYVSLCFTRNHPMKHLASLTADYLLQNIWGLILMF